jgi:acyl-coenzyme A synthetase/AMP-(fatty) acid ligase
MQQQQPSPSGNSLWGLGRAATASSPQWLWGFERSLRLDLLAAGTCLPAAREDLRGRSALILVGDQLAAAIALLELDGIAKRIVLCPPDFSERHLASTVAAADIDLIVGDASTADADYGQVEKIAMSGEPLAVPGLDRSGVEPTEWVLLTSGTTGPPKLVAHSLRSLTGAIAARPASSTPAVWSTFYDIRRYGGLQIFLRSILGGTSMVLSSPAETAGAFLARAGAHGVTHMSGTPSHWRRALMAGVPAAFAPGYVRLSGEVADQTILDRLREQFPAASIAHAFASTEAGVAFEVGDGQAGFPERLVDADGPVTLAVRDGSLRIRSGRTASRYLGAGAPVLRGADGFVDTGDSVELRDGRYYFAGRRDGVINIGGLKVHPEEVEAVINRHPAVRMCRVKGRSNAITGAIVTADVLADFGGPRASAPDAEHLKKELVDLCKSSLARHKIPAVLRFVDRLELSNSGKVER